MNLFEAAQAASSIMQLGQIVSNAAKVLTDPTSSSEDKKDASKAKRLGDKKISEKDKNKMYNGGMANGRKHMYLGGDSSVQDNAGLRALKASGPRGMEAYKKITGK